MINSIIAYNSTELEKKKVLLKAEDLFRSKLLDTKQWQQIRKEYASKLYTPSIFMRVLLFIFSFLGMTTVIGPIGAIFSDMGESGYRVLSFLLGILFLFGTEKLLIKDRHHFHSGITEAGIYSGLAGIAFGILGSNPPGLLVCAITGFVLTAFAAIRYLNIPALVSAIGFLGWIVFQLMTAIGGIAEACMPFIFMATFATIHWYGTKLRVKLPNVIFDDQFVVLKTMTLLVFYLAGNYYVVREMSIRLMGLQLSAGDNIPFAIVFYLFTALVPAGYMYWGIKQKSILLIRIGLLTLALSVLTFTYYFLTGFQMLAATIAGAALLATAWVFYRYLKQMRNGFTREKLLHDQWNSTDLTAIIASQTLGGNKMNDPGEDVIFKGGSFGGAGAGRDW